LTAVHDLGGYYDDNECATRVYNDHDLPGDLEPAIHLD